MTEVYMSVKLSWNVKNSVMVLVFWSGSFSWDSWGLHFSVGGKASVSQWVGCPIWVFTFFFSVDSLLPDQAILACAVNDLYLDWPSLFTLCVFCLYRSFFLIYQALSKAFFFLALCSMRNLRENKFRIRLKVALFLEVSNIF